MWPSSAIIIIENTSLLIVKLDMNAPQVILTTGNF